MGKKKTKTIPGELTDAFAMAREHPETFEAPTIDETDAISEGDLVKICVTPEDDMPPERFWLEVTETEGFGEDRKITGTVSNDLLFVDLDFGDAITVQAKNLYAIEMSNE